MYIFSRHVKNFLIDNCLFPFYVFYIYNYMLNAHMLTQFQIAKELIWNMKTLGRLEDVVNLTDGMKTFLCESVEDLIAVEKELKENLSNKYDKILQSLVIYNPFHPHYSSSDVVGTFPDKG